MNSTTPNAAAELSGAQECIAIGRMLQVQPTTEALGAFFELFPALPRASAEELEQDYLRLFVGLGMPLAPPWESAWASDARLIFQRETLDVRYWYRSQGLQSVFLSQEPDDHIGLELEFYGTLIERGLAGEAERFAREHPLAWVDRWHAAVTRHAQHPFYPALATRACALLRTTLAP